MPLLADRPPKPPSARHPTPLLDPHDRPPPSPHFLGRSAGREERPPSRGKPVHSLVRRRGVAQLGSAPASGAGMSRRARPRDGAPAMIAISPGHIPGHVGRRLMPFLAGECGAQTSWPPNRSGRRPMTSLAGRPFMSPHARSTKPGRRGRRALDRRHRGHGVLEQLDQEA